MPTDSAHYRVEVHDGKSWTFGIRLDDNLGYPRFCSLENADIGSLEDITLLKKNADTLCGGTLRIAAVPPSDRYTLPTIHLNGTGAKTLHEEYKAVRRALIAASDALIAATCNPRDFYPQGPGPEAYHMARAQRAEALRQLEELQRYAAAWEEVAEARL